MKPFIFPATTKKIPIQTVRRIILAVLGILAITIGLIYYYHPFTAKNSSSTQQSSAIPTLTSVSVASDQNHAATATLQGVLNGPHTFAEAQKAAEAAVNERIDSVHQLQSGVDSYQYLDPADKKLLDAELSQTADGLTSLGKSIADATEETDAFKGLVSDITAKYAVYSLLIPKVQGIELVATNKQSVQAGVNTANDLDSTAKDAKSKGKDTAQLEKDIATYRDKLTNIDKALNQAAADFTAINLANRDISQQYRDAGINTLAQANSLITDASKFLTSTIAGEVQAVK